MIIFFFLVLMDFRIRDLKDYNIPAIQFCSLRFPSVEGEEGAQKCRITENGEVAEPANGEPGFLSSYFLEISSPL